MSDDQPATPPGPFFVLLFLLGIILLLPGLCSLVFAISLLSGRGSFTGLELPIIVVGLAIGAIGVALIAFAIKRARRSRRS
jgi:hypothetical protein